MPKGQALLVGVASHLAKVLSRKQRLRSRPAHSCTPTMPKMKKTKKQSRSTFPSMGRVSSSSVTRIRMPARGRVGVSTGTFWSVPCIPSPSQAIPLLTNGYHSYSGNMHLVPTGPADTEGQ